MRRSSILKFSLVVALGLAFAPLARPQKQLAGEWVGTLNTPNGVSHVAWHVTAAQDGTVISSFDNQDEGISGIKVKTLELKDSAINATVDDVVQANGSPITIRGTLSGTLSKDGNTVTGTWTQTEPEQGPIDLVLKREGTSGTPVSSSPAGAGATAAPAGTSVSSSPGQSQLTGDWTGVLAGQLHLVLHIAGKDGALTATLDSVDQGANGIPINSVTLKDGKLSLTIDALHGSYEGTVNKDATQIDGTWSQGQSTGLMFKRSK